MEETEPIILGEGHPDTLYYRDQFGRHVFARGYGAFSITPEEFANVPEIKALVEALRGANHMEEIYTLEIARLIGPDGELHEVAQGLLHKRRQQRYAALAPFTQEAPDA